MAEKKSIIEKTDRAVKTAESWWSFGREAYQMIGATLGFATFISAGIIQIWQSALAVGWEYYAVTIPPVLIITALTLRFSVWKWRQWRSSKDILIPDAFDPAPFVANDHYDAIIKKVDDQFRKINVEFTEFREDITKQMASLKALTIEKSAHAVAEAARVEANWDHTAEDMERKISKRIDDLFESQRLTNAIRFGHIAETQHARTMLIRYDALTKTIREISAKLEERPMNDNWDVYFKSFKSRLRDWDKFKDEYPVSDYKPLFDVNPEILENRHWTNDVLEIEDQNLLLRYKHYRIYNAAFEANAVIVRRDIENTATREFWSGAASLTFIDRFR
jgi:hypothetical protein